MESFHSASSLNGKRFMWTRLGMIVSGWKMTPDDDHDDDEEVFSQAAQEIVPGMFLGACPAAGLRTRTLVERYNILTIFTVAKSVAKTDELLAETDVPAAFRDHICLPINDDPTVNLLPFMQEGLQHIDRALAAGSVLVHCESGVSRSVAFVCAWLMTRRNMTYNDALVLVKAKRPRACPNLGFQRQLRLIEFHANDIHAAKEHGNTNA